MAVSDTFSKLEMSWINSPMIAQYAFSNVEVH